MINRWHKEKCLVLFLFCLLFFASFFTIQSFAAQTCTTDEQIGQVTCTNSATASVTVAAACSFSRTSGSGEYSGILANNASVEVTGSTFSTTCNDSGGYAIYAIGYGNNTFGNTDLIFDNDPDNTNKITTSSSPESNTSYWQMKLAAGAENHPVLENGYGSYSAVPSTYTKVASYASADMGTAQTVTATYRAAASATQPAGTYTGAVKYTMVHPNTNIPNQPYNCAVNKICYFPNAGNVVEDTMGNQNITASSTNATLWTSNFKRPGYGFAGWSDAYDYVANEGSESNSDAHIYGPNEDVTFAAGQYSGANGGLSLYAVWVEPAKDSNGNELTFQTNNLLTTTLADGTTLGSKNNGFVTALRDRRDGQVYAVAKLADGNYWMIENLRLEAEYTRGSYYESLAQGYGTSIAYGDFIGLADTESTGFSDDTIASSVYYSGTQSGTATINIGVVDHPGYRFPRYNDNNVKFTTTMATGVNQNIFYYGNYYTWAAAIADTAFYATNNSSITDRSICPTGWRLPKGGQSTVNTTADFYVLTKNLAGMEPNNLNNGYSYYQGVVDGVDAGVLASKALRKYPNNFIYSGRFSGSSIGIRGSGGRYWTSTISNTNIAYYLSLNSSYVRPGTFNDDKFNGFSVRCVIGN